MAAEVKPRRLPPWTVEEHPIHSSSATQPGWLTPISIFRESKGLIISDLLTKAGGKLRQIAYQKDATVTRIGSTASGWQHDAVPPNQIRWLCNLPCRLHPQCQEVSASEPPGLLCFTTLPAGTCPTSRR